jgi:AraC family transcriptional regulator
MYDECATSYRDPRETPSDTTTVLPMDEMAEATWASFHRLQSAVLELSTALDETLRDRRGIAVACLQRAQAILQGVVGASAPASENRAPQGLAPWQVRKVFTHIDANLGTCIRNEDLAALARLSVCHFNVAFRNSIGSSPHQYVIRRRMERAQGLMLSTDTTLSDIAAECGFADQPHFTRLFRRFVGESPAVWRRTRANPFP